MNRFFNLHKQGKQVVLLYITSLIGIIMGVFSSIVNTRFISPADYGDVRYVQNIISFVASILLVGYFLSGSRLLALSDDKVYCRRVKGVMTMILLLTIFVMMLVCLACYFIYHDNNTLSFLFIVSIPVCSYPILLNYLNTTAQGDNQIGRLTIARLMPALLYVPIAYSVYRFTGATSIKMILLQWGIQVFFLSVIVISMKPIFTNLSPIWQQLKKENKNYGFQLYIGSLVMVATNYLAGISIGYFNTDNSEVGFYTLALTVTSPLMTLPTIIGTAYFKRFASELRIPNKVLLYTILMTVISCLLFIALIKPVVLFLYSKEYSVVGTYCIWLSLGFCLHGLGDMLNRYLGSHGRGKEIRNSSIANGVFKVFGYTVLVFYFNTIGAIITTVLCDFIYASMLYCYYVKYTTPLSHSN